MTVAEADRAWAEKLVIANRNEALEALRKKRLTTKDEIYRMLKEGR